MDKVVKAVTVVMDQALNETDKLVQAAQQSINQTQTQITDLFQQQVLPLLGDFRTGNQDFSTKLLKLQANLQQLSVDTSTMEKHALSYVSIGQQMNTQLADLQTAQQQVSQQLTAVVTHVSDAATSMETASNSVVNVATSLNTVARTLSGGLQQTVKQMTDNIDRSTRALGQVENSLGVLVPAMAQAASQFANYPPSIQQTASQLAAAVQ